VGMAMIMTTMFTSRRLFGTACRLARSI
jgi:hypothetical protein